MKPRQDLENLPVPEEIQEPITKTGDLWRSEPLSVVR